jgi:hypothetical protein
VSVTPILALLPESQYTWTLTHQLQPYIAQIPTEVTESTVGSDIVHTYAPQAIPSNELAITCCAAKDGNVWVLYDDNDIADASILRKFNKLTGELIFSTYVNPLLETGGGGDFVRIGDLGSYKSLMEADCGHMLSVDRNTREVVLIKVESQEDALTPGVGDRAFPLTFLTSTGTTASGSRVSHGIPIGAAVVTIDGAEQDEYNGTFAATVVDADSFTYTFAGSGTSTATGFITATFAADSDNEIGRVVKRFGLSVTPLDAAINSAGTRLLYLEDACAKLYDLENDEFIRIVVANIPCFGDGSDGSGGGGSAAAPCSSTTGPPTGPPWFLSLLTGAGATNCWDAAILTSLEGTLNGMGYYLQRSSGCAIRGRLYYDPGGAVTSALCSPFLDATHFNRYADTTRADGGWQFVANF